MEIKRFGDPAGKTIMLLHGNLMCWRQFEDVIPLLEKTYCVYAVSFDGFDGTGQTTYTTAQEQAHKLEAYILEHCGGALDILFAESLGCGPAIFLQASPQIQVRHMILSGPEYLDFGPLNKPLLNIMPQKQYRTAREKPIYYEFTACPVAEFAIQHGLTDIMAALCNVDYASMELIHARLIRTTTCANGCKCDFTICGDRDPYLKDHPEYRDENGYRRNT